MLKVVQAAFNLLQLVLAPSLLDKQAASCKLPYDWLVSLAMDLAVLFDM